MHLEADIIAQKYKWLINRLKREFDSSKFKVVGKPMDTGYAFAVGVRNNETAKWSCHYVESESVASLNQSENKAERVEEIIKAIKEKIN